MGCDGGSIPKRIEMVKLKKKDEKAQKDAALVAKWKHCAISSQLLREPVVACGLGNLYNKESVIEALLDPAKMPELASHIKSLKDVTELNLTPNPSAEKNAKSLDQFKDAQSAAFICPITSLEMSGVYRFVFLRSCGCVFSEKALKEAPSEVCHTCGKPFDKMDLLVLNGDEKDVENQKAFMEERKKQVKVAKKKRKVAESLQNGHKNGKDEEVPSEKKLKCSAVKKFDAKPCAPKDKRSQKDTNGSNLSGATKHIVQKMAKHLANDPEKDELKSRKAYKSIFTSSQETVTNDKKKPHWVTFNSYH